MFAYNMITGVVGFSVLTTNGDRHSFCQHHHHHHYYNNNTRSKRKDLRDHTVCVAVQAPQEEVCEVGQYGGGQ